jgi:hypothetical protein
MGNKRKLATKILNTIYETVGDFNILYDLFGGGGSMSVAGLIAGHKVYYNELNKGVYSLMQHLKNNGKLPNKWISREEFNEHKNGDDWYAGFISCCWSFGNNQSDYLFGKDIENLKKQAHQYLLENGYNGMSESRNKLLEQFKKEKTIIGKFELQQLQQLQQLQRLQQLEQLEQLERLERLEISNKSYEKIEIIAKSIVYCDIPYKGTKKYKISFFDYDKFYEWCLKNDNPVFISEYSMPKEFKKVGSWEHRCTLSAKANNAVTENLFWNGKTLS